MTLLAQFVHRIDPVLLQLGGVRFWWYGAAYAIGFVGVLAWFCCRGGRLGMSPRNVLELSVLFAACHLLGGRAFEIVFYEWDYYWAHPAEILRYWHGGMASHGVLIGSVVGLWIFARWRGFSVWRLLDEIAVPGAFFLALGRVGNFINGKIYGPETDVWWGVMFPGEDVYRHPVTLYESLKNAAIIPILLWVGRKSPPGRGVMIAHFLFWYGFLRIFADLFREYGTTVWGIGTGQYFNAALALCGLSLMTWRYRARPGLDLAPMTRAPASKVLLRNGDRVWIAVLAVAFIGLLFLSLIIPASWTQGVLEELRAQRTMTASTAALPPS